MQRGALGRPETPCLARSQPRPRLSCSLNSPGFTFHFLVQISTSGAWLERLQGCELPPPSAPCPRERWRKVGSKTPRGTWHSGLPSLARFPMTPEQCPRLSRPCDPLTIAAQRETQREGPHPLSVVTLQVLSTSAVVSTHSLGTYLIEDTHRFQSRSALVGLAIRGWDRRAMLP